MISLDEVSVWYKGPLTKRRISELRRKLARARGLLEELKYEVNGYEEVQAILDETADS